MSTSIRLLSDRVIVRPLEAADKTRGGIIIPDSAKEKPARGIVVGVGPGMRRRDGVSRFPMADVKPGDEVYYGKYAGSEFKMNGIEHRIMRDDDLLAVVEP